MATLPKPFFTEQEYLEIDRAAEVRSEYLDGQIFEMSAISAAHSRLTWNLTAILAPQLRGKQCVGFGSNLRVKVPRGNFYTYPDLSVACGPQFTTDKADTLANPVLLIEVLSQSTRDYDRGEKLRRYRTIPSFVEYLLVDQYAVGVEHWTKQPDGSWLVRETLGLDAEVVLESIGCRIRLADVYESVELIAG
jgi:Uma2 family endonuclease